MTAVDLSGTHYLPTAKSVTASHSGTSTPQTMRYAYISYALRQMNGLELDSLRSTALAVNPSTGLYHDDVDDEDGSAARSRAAFRRGVDALSAPVRFTPDEEIEWEAWGWEEAADWKRWGFSEAEASSYRAGGFRTSWRAYMLYGPLGRALPPVKIPTGLTATQLERLGKFAARFEFHGRADLIPTALTLPWGHGAVGSDLHILRLAEASDVVERIVGGDRVGEFIHLARHHSKVWPSGQAIQLLRELRTERQLVAMDRWYWEIERHGATLADVREMIADGVPYLWAAAAVGAETVRFAA